MSEFKVGDKVRVVKVEAGCEDWGYAVGDVLTVSRVNESPMYEEPVIDVEEGAFDLYMSEVEPYVEEPAFFLDGALDWGVDVGKEVIYDAYNPDAVKAPEHYVNSRIEPIDYMADKLPAYEDGFVAFCVGNALKYLSRAPHKGAYLQDLKKARQYMEFAIDHEEKKEQE